MKIHKLKLRALVRIFSFAAALVVALTGFIIQSNRESARLSDALEYTYQRNLAELSEHLDKINSALKKGLYAGTASGLSDLAVTIWGEAGAAKTCLSQLPNNGASLEKINKFLSQSGEYCRALANKVASGEKVSDEERQQLLSLSGYAQSFCDSVLSMCHELDSQNALKGSVTRILSDRSPSDPDPLSTALSGVEETFADFPTLLYDGPFSDHILQAEPLFLKGKAEVDGETAKQRAATVLSCAPEALVTDSNEDGVIASYDFSFADTSVSITRAGGYCSYFMNSRTISDRGIDYEFAIEKGRSFLAGLGLGEFKESYYVDNNGECIINFAAVSDGIVFYSDLIKVGVAMDNGDIISLNAQGYLMNHTDRSFGTPRYTLADAQTVLSPYLSIQSAATAVIPLNDRQEQLCYEFYCLGTQGEEILVYVNANSLQEENILLVLKTDGGTLTL